MMICRDYNAVAPLTNSSLAVLADSQLIPLRKSNNQEVDEFPVSQSGIDRLNCELRSLFLSWGHEMSLSSQ